VIVAQDNIVPPLPHCSHGLSAVGRLMSNVALLSEQISQEEPHVLIVVYDQDALAAAFHIAFLSTCVPTLCNKEASYGPEAADWAVEEFMRGRGGVRAAAKSREVRGQDRQEWVRDRMSFETQS
jgi:hypothetical protein